MAEKNHKILEKSLKMLDFVSKNDGVSLTEICNAVEIPKGSAFILLNTFVNMRYMKKDKNGLYRTGIALFELGTRFVDNNEFFRTAREVLEGLVRAVDETAHLAVLDGTDAVYVCKYECSHTVRMVSFVGKRLPAHGSAIGKALLSGYTEAEIHTLYGDRELEIFTPHTIRDLDVLIEQVRETRLCGFAAEHEESTPGVECVAVPVVSRHSGQVEAAISISVPVSRSSGHLEQFKEPLWNAKRSLEILL